MHQEAFKRLIFKTEKELQTKKENFIKEGDVTSHPVWRNEECALESTKRVVRLAQKHKKKIHILHVSTKEEIDFFSEKRDGVTFEITPQHLTLYAPDCYENLKTFSQMNPPLRDKSHYDR